MIRILVVSDIRFYRDGLAQALSCCEELVVVGQAEDLNTAASGAAQLHPDVVLIDEGIANSLAAVRAVAALSGNIKIVALAVPDADERVIACAEAGVAGYVPRQAGILELIATIQSVSRGELLCSARVAATLLRRVAALASGASPIGGRVQLTPRELQVLRMLERGLTNKDIARELGIEVATAKNHVHSILGKVGCRRRGQAAARMREYRDPRVGWTQPPGKEASLV